MKLIKLKPYVTPTYISRIYDEDEIPHYIPRNIRNNY